jgi:hypothetical protein
MWMLILVMVFVMTMTKFVARSVATTLDGMHQMMLTEQ